MRKAVVTAVVFMALLASAPAAPAHFFTDEAIESLAPVVIFHGGERYHPSSGEEFIDHSGLAWSHNDGCVRQYHRKRFQNGIETPWSEIEILTLSAGGFVQRLRGPRKDSAGSCRPLAGDANLFNTTLLTRPYEKGRSEPLGKAEGWYLDLSNEDRSGFPNQASDGDRYETLAPTYFDDGLLYANGAPTGFAFVTYWFFYSYNDGLGPQNHEGDWENISVRLRPISANRWRPMEVFYAKHGNKPLLVIRHPDVVPWSDAARVSSSRESRLEVYSARGSHGSYGNGVAPWTFFDKIDRDGPAWETWRQLRFVWRQDWAGYCGAWGTVGGIPDTSGPLGPACMGLDRRPFKSGRPGAWGTSRVPEFDQALGNTIAVG